jgi:hypothetical protein
MTVNHIPQRPIQVATSTKHPVDTPPPAPSKALTEQGQNFQAMLLHTATMAISTEAGSLAADQALARSAAAARLLIPTLSAGAAAVGGGVLATIWSPGLGQKELYTLPGSDQYRISVMTPERHGRIERQDFQGHWSSTLVEVTPVYTPFLGPAHPRKLIGFKPLSDEDARQLEQLPGFPSDTLPLPSSTASPAVSPLKPESTGFPQASPPSPVLPGRSLESAKPHSTSFPVTTEAETLLQPVMQQEKTEVGYVDGLGYSTITSNSLNRLFERGRTPKASELKKFAEEQGWKPTQTANGPLKYIDENGINRLTIKQGSSRAPGSSNPHMELRDASGQRIDPAGNPVNRKSPSNHTPIDFDL